MFEFLNEKLILTANGQTRSIWNLPNWMYPSDNKLPLSYHEKHEKWKQKERATQLTSASRGQEFVLDTSFYPEACEWLFDLIKTGISKNH